MQTDFIRQIERIVMFLGVGVMMNSYQKRKNEIKYLQQRGKDLENIIIDMYKYMKQQKIKPLIPLTGKSVTGDMYINDISTGQLQQHLINVAEELDGAHWNEEHLEKLKAKAQ